MGDGKRYIPPPRLATPSSGDDHRSRADPGKAEARDAVPVRVRDSGDHGSLRPARRDGRTPRGHTWDEFEQRFDDDDLVFVYHEEEPTGEEMGFFEIVEREHAFERADLGRTNSRTRCEVARR